MKHLFSFSFKFYRLYLFPLLAMLGGGNYVCRFHPSCSHFAEEALRRHGIIRGGSLALKRLLSCTAFHPGGYDPVPQ